MAKHPAIAAAVSITLTASVALQSIVYTFSRTKVKSAIAGSDTSVTPVVDSSHGAGVIA
jgi:hypothetical protein